MAPELSVIIVNYKTPEYLLNSIRSVFENGMGLSIEVIVVDNDSQDESSALIKNSFPEVNWIDMGYNAGFARANNKGIAAARGQYLLLLNSDTLILKEALQNALIHYKKLEKNNKNPGLLGCCMKDMNGKILFNSNDEFPGITKIWDANPLKILINRWCRKKANDNTEKKLIGQHSVNHESAWVGAAFALFNRKLIDRDHLLLDEDFFMYGEDVEWCYRIAKKGYHHFFCNDAEIIHINCGSSTESPWKTYQIVISEWLFIYKTRGLFYYRIYMILLRFNLLLDEWLYLKSAKKKNMDIPLVRSFRQVMQQYHLLIPEQYKTQPSSGRQFLRYDV